MKQIRIGMFETNSSSTHSLIVCSTEEFQRFEKGEINLDLYTDSLIEVTISDKEKARLVELYEKTKGSYWKDWSDLSENEKNEWFFNHQPSGMIGLKYDDLSKYSYVIQEIKDKDLVAISVYADDY